MDRYLARCRLNLARHGPIPRSVSPEPRSVSPQPSSSSPHAAAGTVDAALDVADVALGERDDTFEVTHGQARRARGRPRGGVGGSDLAGRGGARAEPGPDSGPRPARRRRVGLARSAPLGGPQRRGAPPSGACHASRAPPVRRYPLRRTASSSAIPRPPPRRSSPVLRISPSPVTRRASMRFRGVPSRSRRSRVTLTSGLRVHTDLDTTR